MVVLYSDCSQDKVFCLSDYNHFSLVTISWVYTYMNEYEREGGDEIRYILLIALVAVAVVSDIRTFRIPNRLNALGCMVGLTVNIFTGGISGAKNSLIGMTVPVLMLAVLFCLHIVGAGDIKLFSAMGAVIGADIWRIVVFSFVVTAFAGILMVAFRLIRKVYSGCTRIHLSVSIAVGTLIYVIGGVFGEL